MAKKRLNPKSQKRSQKKSHQPREIREENNLDKFFLLHLKKSLLIIIVWAVLIIAHNLIFRIYGVEEAFLSAIAVYLLPLYLLASILYTLARHKKAAQGR